MFYYAPKNALICYYAFNVYYAQNYASRIGQGLPLDYIVEHDKVEMDQVNERTQVTRMA